jgi:hypothetical protein
MVTFSIGVYSITTGRPIANAGCTIDATPQPAVGISLYGAKRLTRNTDINGQVLIDATAFGFLIYEDGMYWNWNVGVAADGYQNQSTGTSSTPGNNAYVVVKMTPTPVATAPPPTAGAIPVPTTGGIVIPTIPNPITDAIKQVDTSVNKTVSTVSKTLIIGAIILVAVIGIMIYLATPHSPAPIEQVPTIVVRGPRARSPAVQPARVQSAEVKIN